MSIDKEKMLQLCNDWCKNTLMETLEIEYIDAGEDFLRRLSRIGGKCGKCRFFPVYQYRKAGSTRY
jgi:hypothetical protein